MNVEKHTVHTHRPSFFVRSFDVLVAGHVFTKRYPPPRSLLDLNLFHFVSLTTRSHRPPLPSSSSVCQLFNVARGGGVNAWPISRLDNGPRCRTSFSIARSLIHLDDEALREISNDIFYHFILLSIRYLSDIHFSNSLKNSSIEKKKKKKKFKSKLNFLPTVYNISLSIWEFFYRVCEYYIDRYLGKFLAKNENSITNLSIRFKHFDSWINAIFKKRGMNEDTNNTFPGRRSPISYIELLHEIFGRVRIFRQKRPSMRLVPGTDFYLATGWLTVYLYVRLDGIVRLLSSTIYQRRTTSRSTDSVESLSKLVPFFLFFLSLRLLPAPKNNLPVSRYRIILPLNHRNYSCKRGTLRSISSPVNHPAIRSVELNEDRKVLNNQGGDGCSLA